MKEQYPLVQPEAVEQYKKAKLTNNKLYPSIEVVRLEKLFFNGKKGKILDYGIGGGCNSFHFLKLGYKVHGLDVSSTSLKMIKHICKKNKIKVPKLFLLKKNDRKLPFPDSSFDYVIGISVLSLLGSRKKIKYLLSEFRRILKKKGKIILDMNDHNSEFSQNKKQIAKNVFISKIVTNKIRCYCLKNIHEFENLIKPYFKISDKGFSAHSVFKRRIREFIICAEKK
tara:strand:- start:7518 stop:8195 length:678 start_codon:yes stop_codon:yes gene_type:complete